MTEFTISQSLHSLAPVCLDGGVGCLIRIHPADDVGGFWQLDGDAFVIGRVGECDIQVMDESVSRHHAAIRFDGVNYVVSDLGSTNGTFVNDERISEKVLEPEDRIRIGQQIFKYLAADDIEVQYHHTLYRMVTTDGLTQAHNRQYMEEALERELTRARRHQRPLAMLMMDIDHFKQVNDSHGHLAGDEVLREFSRRARLQLEDEIFCRYGGEEFAVVAGECDRDTAIALAESIRKAVAEKPFETSDGLLEVTVSIGVVEALTVGCQTVTELMSGADSLLYQAKESGRNQVAACAPE
ncbi:MAG: GGDEF domain-containing protein [Planctomycetales bacterium]|nr:GGDEF domain-containing protein [Planctomycetales bacterium]